MTFTTIEPTITSICNGTIKTGRTNLRFAMEHLADCTKRAGVKPTLTEEGGYATFSYPEFTIRIYGLTPLDLRTEWEEVYGKRAAQESTAQGCDRCIQGTYCWGAIVNGKPTFQGTCWKCGGTGIAPADGRWVMSV